MKLQNTKHDLLWETLCLLYDLRLVDPVIDYLSVEVGHSTMDFPYYIMMMSENTEIYRDYKLDGSAV